MKKYRYLRWIEKVRYLSIVLLIQLPAYILLGYGVGNSVRLYVESPQNFGAVYFEAVRDYMQNIPYPLMIWGMVVLVVHLVTTRPLFSIKGQYLTHLEHLLILEYNEYAINKRKEVG